ANVRAYADIVRERAIRRELIRTSTEIADSAYDPRGRDTRELLDDAEKRVFAIAERGSRAQQGFTGIKELMARTVERIDILFQRDNPITCIPTGWQDFDEMTAGLQRGDLIVVAGRPSMGKTALAMNIVEFAAIQVKCPVAVFSMEMPGESLIMRLVSSLGRIDQHKVRTGRLEEEDWPRLTSAVTMLSEARLFIDDSSSLSPNDLRARARRLHRQEGQLGLIVVDYLQLMQVPGTNENRATEVSEISRSLKSLAKELSVPVLALSQLNRTLEQRGDKRPIMSDLRECVTGDTQVMLADGRRLPIRELVGTEPEVLALSEERRVIQARSDLVWSVGIKPIFRVSLASGRQICATGRHRLYGSSGWVRVSDIAVGDRLAVARFAPEPIMDGDDVFWDRVVSIQPDGEEEVFDLTVPGPASWLADGIVCHNSGAIEQDADLICFIYRDEVYNPDSPDKGKAEIIIGKQRNGPIGMIPLTFLGRYTRFESYAPEFQSTGSDYESSNGGASRSGGAGSQSPAGKGDRAGPAGGGRR
ncbi:MAG: replicative DNA helicase, partial [Candidatus Methylophosphatis roskildensis]